MVIGGIVTSMDIIMILMTIFVAIIVYYYHAYTYWSRKGVVNIQPHFPLGNANTLLPHALSVGVFTRNFYQELKRLNCKFGGVYLVTEPNLVIIDPDYIRDILQKDFQYFVDRGFYHNETNDPISAHLFAIGGQKWRHLRTKLTPTFTSGKMKFMFDTVIQCSNYMKEALDKTTDIDIDIKEVLGCYSTDVIGSCAFGINCNSFLHPDAEFRRMGKRIFYYDIWRSIRAFFIVNLPSLSLKLGLTANNRDVQDFFTNMVRNTVKTRQEQHINRKDFLQILIDLKEHSDLEKTGNGQALTIDEMAAQVFAFFIAGFETSSTIMTFALYELARNPVIQEKLRAEIEEVLSKSDGKITYDNLKEMKYLDQVLDEAFRMYPPVPTLNRRCVKDYVLRDTKIVIQAGTPILIPVMGIHRDPEYYPDPDRFDPERFSEEHKKTRHTFVHLPFGEGPRNCIGLRFGSMQSKIGIATIIKNFKLTPSPNMKPDIEFDPYMFLLNTTDTIYLRAEKL